MAKKIIYVIVEGPSDDTALSVILQKLFSDNKIYVEITHGDITTKNGVNTGNIVSKLGNIIKSYANNNHYKYSDFHSIIHIVDMDGVYIPDDLIIETDEYDETFYTEENILTSNKNNIIKRNKQKRENLNRLSSHNTIWRIPYKVYYMSCNLDHVLYNKQNSSDEDKENDSYEFADKYKDKLQDFLRYISDSEFSLKTDFKDSWMFIMDGTNSLKRYTNLCIIFKEIYDKIV